jgi:hypothetical protein
VPYFAPHPWFRLAVSAAHLAFEAQTLVGLRLLRIATGGVAALPEIGRMVPEKVDALLEAQRIALFSIAGGELARAPARQVRMYRRRVKANRTRLDKPAAIKDWRT